MTAMDSMATGRVSVTPNWPKSALAVQVPALVVPGDPEAGGVAGKGIGGSNPDNKAVLTGTGSSSLSSETADVCIGSLVKPVCSCSFAFVICLQFQS